MKMLSAWLGVEYASTSVAILTRTNQVRFTNHLLVCVACRSTIARFSGASLFWLSWANLSLSRYRFTGRRLTSARSDSGWLGAT